MLSIWVAAAIGAAAAIGGGLLGGAAGKKEASKLRDWQAQQYAQRYQVTMADMRAAGLNPMLAYSQGPGQAPSGAQGDISGISGGFSSAGALAAQANIRKTQSANTKAQTLKVKEETVSAHQAARLSKMKADDYEKAGDSILGRQAVSAGRLGAAGYELATKPKPPRRAGKQEKIGPPKKSKRGVKWRSRKKGTTFGPGYKGLSFDEALRRMRNR